MPSATALTVKQIFTTKGCVTVAKRSSNTNTVNSENFARVLFSGNTVYTKFREKKTLRNGEITLSFND